MKPVRANIGVAPGAGREKGVSLLKLTNVESYSIETSMDNDADPWTIEIGDPSAELSDLLRRDTEIRVAIFGGEAQTQYLKTGIADSAFISESGTLSINGRDVSSLAVDSQHPPGEWKNARAHKRVKKEAAELGIPKVQVKPVSPFSKIYTDGSETYWEFWYRMYRKRKMWIWAEPDGTLVADELNYSSEPKYFFGKKSDKFGNGKWLPVIAVERQKNTNKRVGKAIVFGENNDTPYFAMAQDASIRHWLKKPTRIFYDRDIRSKKEAREMAFEEIFEGKVGSVEIRLVVSDPDRLIQQNEVAAINIPEVGLSGKYFIVGVTILGSSGQGFVQEIRLRERQFALTRRVPDDPELAVDENAPSGSIVGIDLPISKKDWSIFFWRAAQRWAPTGVPLDLFTAALLAICEVESNFRNVRSGVDANGNSPRAGRIGVEWYPPPSGAPGVGSGPPGSPGAPGLGGATNTQWLDDFANHRENPRIGAEFAVGPMQLYTRSYKTDADAHGGRSGEYNGGRWMPQSNIWIAARVLGRDKMSGLPPTKAGLYEAIKRYNGSGPAAEAYMRRVIALIENKYLEGVQSGIENAQEIPKGGGKILTIGGVKIVFPHNMPGLTEKMVRIALKQMGKPYQWGGTGPNTFDCSGLAVYAFRQAGSNMTRHNTYSFWDNFPRVPFFNHLLIGDLVMFNNLGHMGIYLGNGHMVQAPSTGDVVKISPITSGYYRQRYYGAVRVVTWPTGAIGL